MNARRHGSTNVLVLSLIACLMLASSFAMIATQSRQSSLAPLLSDTPAENGFQISYQTHAPIIIVSDADFAQQAASEIWPGHGTYLDPYIISGYNIVTSYSCIVISDVSVYFVIRDCYLETLWGGGNFGIHIENTDHGVIEDCTITHAGRGIYVQQSTGVTIENNDISDNMRYGILILESSFCTVSDNVLYDNMEGLRVSYSSNCIIQDNYAHDNYLTGFVVYQTLDTILLNNVAGVNTDYGFEIEYSNDCTLTFNTAQNTRVGGFYLNHSFYCVLSSNTAQDSIIGYHAEGSDFCTLEDNIAHHNSQYGFAMDNSDFCSLQENIAYLNADSGFKMDSTTGSTLAENVAYNNSRRGFFHNDFLMGSISDNLAYYNSEDGFLFVDAEDTTIIYNTARDNLENGFLLGGSTGSTNCSVLRNVVLHNQGYGITISATSSLNLLHGNVIGWNDVGNALDDGSSNNWDDGISWGNLWNDYGGSGTYPISGNASAVDHFPITADLSPPTSDEPDDILYTVGDVGNRIEWSVQSDMPKSYQILRNGVLVDSGLWNGSSLSQNVDGLNFGEYNYTILVFDLLGNHIADYVNVTVVIATTQTDFFGIDMQTLILIGTGAILLIACGIIQWKKELYK